MRSASVLKSFSASVISEMPFHSRATSVAELTCDWARASSRSRRRPRRSSRPCRRPHGKRHSRLQGHSLRHGRALPGAGRRQPVQVDAGRDAQAVQHVDHVLRRHVAGRPLGVGAAAQPGHTGIEGMDAQRQTGMAACQPGAPPVRLQRDRLVEAAQCLVVAPRQRQRAGEIVAGDSVFRLQVDRRPKLFDRAVDLEERGLSLLARDRMHGYKHFEGAVLEASRFGGVFRFDNRDVLVAVTAIQDDIAVNQKGTFDRAVKAIRAAKKAGFRVNVNCTVFNNMSADEAIEYFDFFRNVDGILWKHPIRGTFSFSSAAGKHEAQYDG